MQPNEVPAIFTERLHLTAFSADDKDNVFAYANNPKVAANVTWDAHKSPDDSLAFINWISTALSMGSEKACVIWALRERHSKRAIGSFSFAKYSEIAGQIDYALGVDHWNKGLTTEAAKAVTAWAYATFPKLNRIQAKCLVDNIGSRRVMEKVGMKFEGITRAGMIVKGATVDLATYAVLRADL